MMPIDRLLTEDEAAIELGITKELLFAYIRNAPKQHLGHKQKLIPQRVDGQLKFSTKQLDDWNKYLHNKWSTPTDPRPKIPSYIREYLKVESGGKCALCGKGHKLEDAHIIDYAVSQSHHHHNLIRLCSDCHDKFDDKIIPVEEIRAVKSALVNKLKQEIQEKSQLSKRNLVHRVPQPNQIFIGRKKELKNLKSRLRKERVIIVEGIGGIGKTQLVLHCLQELDDTPTFWFDVESYTSFNDLQLAVLPALLQENLRVQTKPNFFDALNEQPLRIVFDGLDRLPINEWDQVIDFLNDFIKLTNKPKIIITTQVELNNLEVKFYKSKLPPLTLPESEELITKGCQTQNDIVIAENDLKWVAAFCEGHALTLQIVVGLLRYYKRSEVVIDQIQAAGAEELKDPVRTDQKRSTSLQACLKAAYSCFSHEQKRLLQYISNFPAGCLDPHAKSWAKADTFQVNLAELRRFFFVEVRPDEWLTLHRLYLLNPVRQFVRDEWQKTGYEEAASIQMDVAVGNMMQAGILRHNYLESSDIDEVKNGLIRIESELSNYVYTIRYAQWGAKYKRDKNEDATSFNRIVAYTASFLSKYFFIRGLLQIGINYLEAGIAARKQLGELEELVNGSEDYVMLSTLQIRMHDYEGAQRTVQKIVDLGKATGNPKINALAALSAGELNDQQGKHRQAIKNYEIATRYFRDSLQEHNRKLPEAEQENLNYNLGMLGLTLSAIGVVYQHIKLPAIALSYHLEAFNYCAQAGDHSNLGSINHDIGNCYSMLGYPEKAIVAYIEAIRNFVQLGYRQFISNALGEMADAVLEAGFDSNLDTFLDSDLLMFGLRDVADEIKLLVAKDIRPVQDDIQLLRKLFGLVKLVSFSSKSEILEEWALELGNEVVAPLLAINVDDPDHQHETFRRFLDAIANIAHIVGVTSKSPKPFEKEHLFRLCIVCEILNQWPHSRPFDWLAALLRYKRIHLNITSSQLYEAIQRAIRYKDISEFKIQ